MSIEEKARVLRESLIFTDIGSAETRILASIAQERVLKAGEIVFWEGDPPACFYVIAKGRIKAVKHTSSGRDFIVAFFGPGEMFGEVAVFQGKPYPATAEASEDAVILGIRGEEFLDFLRANPEVALRIITILGGRLRDAQNRLKDLAAERVEQRLARTLLMLSSKLGDSLPFTRQDIADMSGTTTETAIRVLSRFKESHIIDSTRGKIVITDKQKLELLVDGPPNV